MHPSDRQFSRVGAVAAFAGIVIYAVSSTLHPWVPPHHTTAAFTAYAAERHWALIHLGELLGILLMTAAAIALAWRLRSGRAGPWAMLGAAAMLLCAGVYAIFTAVDGVALGIMVRRWTEAAPESRELVFEAAFAVRQIEGGLFSVQWLMFGASATLFAVAFFRSDEPAMPQVWRRTMGALSAVAGIGALSFAIVQARTGYSDLSMAFQTGLYPGLLWVAGIGALLLRHPAGSIPSTDETF